MIPLNKSPNPPKRLRVQGHAAFVAICALHDATPDEYCGAEPTKKHVFDRNIYGAKSVKKRILKDQNYKCCFCEARFSANAYGDVEHFRPKGAVLSSSTGQLQYPGYYWLAYDWGNLMYACEVCNNSHKRNHFALHDESKRAKTHLDDQSSEAPILINPYFENPADHIHFHKEIPTAKTSRGANCIDILGLKRSDLNDDRRGLLDKIGFAAILSEFDMNDNQDRDFLTRKFPALSESEILRKLDRAKSVCATAAKATQPFAAMIRANFPDLPKA